LFILTLRGEFGLGIAVRLNLLSVALTVIVFGSSNLGLQLAAVFVFFVGSFLTVAYMDRNKKKLVFNSGVSRQLAYPSTQKLERWSACFQWSLALLFFFGGLMLALIGFEETDTTKGVIAICFFFGCFSVIEIIHRLSRRRDH
jgi:hypothetical protein